MSRPIRARVRMPSTAARGDEITIRVMATHPMESGNRRDMANELVPRDMIHRFTVDFDGERLLDIDIGTGVSSNPFFEFAVVAMHSGAFTFAWHEDNGAIHTETARLSVS